MHIMRCHYTHESQYSLCLFARQSQDDEIGRLCNSSWFHAIASNFFFFQVRIWAYFHAMLRMWRERMKNTFRTFSEHLPNLEHLSKSLSLSPRNDTAVLLQALCNSVRVYLRSSSANGETLMVRCIDTGPHEYDAMNGDSVWTVLHTRCTEMNAEGS